MGPRRAPGDADALLLTTGELGRIPVGQVRAQTHSLHPVLGCRARFARSQPSSRGTVATLSRTVR